MPAQARTLLRSVANTKPIAGREGFPVRMRAGELDGFWTEAGGWSIFSRARTDLAPAGAPPVVLVSGLGVSGRYLLPTAQRVAPNHPVYVPDLPGVGRSVLPPRALPVPELADSLAAWLAV